MEGGVRRERKVSGGRERIEREGRRKEGVRGSIVLMELLGITRGSMPFSTPFPLIIISPP